MKKQKFSIAAFDSLKIESVDMLSPIVGGQGTFTQTWSGTLANGHTGHDYTRDAKDGGGEACNVDDSVAPSDATYH